MDDFEIDLNDSMDVSGGGYGIDDICAHLNDIEIDTSEPSTFMPEPDDLITDSDGWGEELSEMMQPTYLLPIESYSEDFFESHDVSPFIVEQAYDGCNFDSDYWNGLSHSEKMDELNQLEDNLAEIQGRPPVEIQSKDLDSFWDMIKGRKSYGYYDPNTEEIYVNSSLLKSPETLPDVIGTVIHEGIHAYQHQCVNGEVEHYNPEQVAEWVENFRNYKSAALYGMETYLNQPVEVFARENAGKLTETLYA